MDKEKIIDMINKANPAFPQSFIDFVQELFSKGLPAEDIYQYVVFFDATRQEIIKQKKENNMSFLLEHILFEDNAGKDNE